MRSLQSFTERTIVLPAWKNPVVPTALNIAKSWSWFTPEGEDHTSNRPLSISTVIGRRCLQGRAKATFGPRVRHALATPACTSFKRGSELDWDGSGRPVMIWACLIPAKYVFTVAGATHRGYNCGGLYRLGGFGDPILG